MTHIWMVEVLERSDGVYLFARQADALAVAAAVRGDGGRCYVTEEPLNDAECTRHLIEAERDR